jgi:hypothetical protein
MLHFLDAFNYKLSILPNVFESNIIVTYCPILGRQKKLKSIVEMGLDASSVAETTIWKYIT